VGDGWRLAVGTLTALPVRPPSRVDPGVARHSLVLAPLAAVPLGLLACVLAWVGREAGLASYAVAVVVVGAVVAGSRAFHVDGLADTADALTSSYDAERSLAVMRSGDTGPAGVAAVVLALLAQTAGTAALLGPAWGPVLLGACVALSRVAHAAACTRGVPAAPGSQLAAPYAGAIGRPAAAALWVGAGVVLAAFGTLAGLPWWRGPLALAVAALLVVLLVRRAVRRLGGVTGDVFGASIETTLAVLLVGLS
jgi:adenosylcobinamide-GDP ribazoletransferase